jgi:2-methylcitrate dehydratase PrpD
VLGLDADGMARAIGLAAHFAGGLNETWVAGTMEYGIQVGTTALHGLMAARLAQDGADAAPTVLEGRTGFFPAVAGIDDAPARVRKALDAGWHITRVSLKSFGACQLAQGPITAALALQERHGIDPEQIARIAVRLNPYEVDYPGTAEQGPFTRFAGSLMSVPFSVAAALRHGQVTMAGMTAFDDALTNRLAQATAVLPDESLKPLDCGMDIALADGTSFSDELRTSKDFFNLSYDRDREVLRGLLPEMNLTRAGLEALADTIAGLESLASAADILELVAAHRAA